MRPYKFARLDRINLLFGKGKINIIHHEPTFRNGILKFMPLFAVKLLSHCQFTEDLIWQGHRIRFTFRTLPNGAWYPTAHSDTLSQHLRLGIFNLSCRNEMKYAIKPFDVVNKFWKWQCQSIAAMHIALARSRGSNTDALYSIDPDDIVAVDMWSLTDGSSPTIVSYSLSTTPGDRCLSILYMYIPSS